ncbi:MAG TPA: VacJ family lipoprotein [Acidiphilium sp.]|nr:MAG: ABC transporter [Acidiphilium sp. 21-60-14]OYV90995.1 MAG: ABC transporter [Acidiphilium sp. 37-60-79]OZB38880.1 MAG: ABC transporter [Acidiphilium sp. 34-60-192]HQT88578.1 VacJ family lipoprotein [Acidiphilium sp.]HQU24548.1 VacJ family lipoprotein [Acidiphilium sp.]
MGFRVSVGAMVAALGSAGLLAGCATPPPQSNVAAYRAYQQQNDPLKPFNKASYRFNNVLDANVLKPVAQGYKAVTTVGIRHHVSDFMSNLNEPGELVNFMAAGKPRDAGTALMRFVVNSTVGIGGIFDPAGSLGYHHVHTDVGLTLAGYGVPPGPYLYLPLFGPSGVRDATQIPVGFVLTPAAAAPPSTGLTIFNYSSDGLHIVNERATYLGMLGNIKATALDPYATFRSLYRQHRAAQLKSIDRHDVPTVPAWYSPAQRAAMQRAVDQKYQKGS